MPSNAPLGFPSHPQHSIPNQPNGVMPGMPTRPVHPRQLGGPGMGGPQLQHGMVSRPPMNIPGMAPGIFGQPAFRLANNIASPTIQHAMGNAYGKSGQPGQPGQMPP